MHSPSPRLGSISHILTAPTHHQESVEYEEAEVPLAQAELDLMKLTDDDGPAAEVYIDGTFAAFLEPIGISGIVPLQQKEDLTSFYGASSGAMGTLTQPTRGKKQSHLVFCEP
jgi:hypothetical protein